MTSQTKGFLAGIATATLSIYCFQQMTQSKKTSTKKTKLKQISTPKNTEISSITNITSSPSEPVMDSPDLPLRMIRKAETAIVRRTSQIIVVVERCTNEHNYSAILRTVEALGIQYVWLISPPTPTSLPDNHRHRNNGDNDDEKKNDDDKLHLQNGSKIQSNTGKFLTLTAAEVETRVNHHIFAQKAAEWLTIREFDTTKECLQALREDDREIWATDLSQEAICLTKDALLKSNTNKQNSTDDLHDKDINVIPKKLAIVFGTEAVGCSTEILQESDKRVYLPLHGFADSLNLSVATALCLQQLFHLSSSSTHDFDSTIVGNMPEEERTELRSIWYPKLAKQRIMTSGQKRHRGKLVGKVKRLEAMERKHQLYPDELTKQQNEKLTSWQTFRTELQAFDKEVEAKAKKSVQQWIQNPPLPLSDMRRADEHRICYVGKNTKNRNKEEWKEMPAVVNTPTHTRKGISASYFREVNYND